MELQPHICANPDVDKLLLEHCNRPMWALLHALKDSYRGIELPMSIIMDRRCGIERRFEEGPSVDSEVKHLLGASPLILAIYTGRLDVAKALLAAGADPNAKAAYGFNSLMVASETEGKSNLEALEYLISNGADINAVDKDGKTPLHYAALLGHASIIELLERAGPNLEAVDDKGKTPLHDAALRGHAIKVL